MPRVSKITYDPSKSVAKNAEDNHVTEEAIRYFIHTRNIDRRFEKKQNIINKCREELKKNPSISQVQLHKITGYSISTIRIYWEYITNKKQLTSYNEHKAKKREASQEKHFKYLQGIPVDVIKEYLKSVSRQEKIKEKERQTIAQVAEWKSLIDECKEVEKKNSQSLQYLPQPTLADLTKWEEYDASKYLCYAFRKKGDVRKGKELMDLGNMCGGYEYDMNGVHFKNSEAAYICGMFSNNTDEHIAIQKELIANDSGFDAKKFVRTPNEDKARKDWYEFNQQWMLFVVWQKVQGNKDFRKLLMAIPEGATIIEDSSFQHGDTATFWGTKNNERRDFYKVLDKYINATETDASGAAKDRMLIKEFNDFTDYGTYRGSNVMGKIIAICRNCLLNGTEPEIDYELLKSKHIHMLGEEVNFDKQYRKPREKKEPVKIEPKKVEPPLEAKVEKVKKKPKAKKASTKQEGIKQEFPLEGKMYHSVLGSIIGDIAGSCREGIKNNTFTPNNKFFTAASTFTDDSVLTIALADWLNHKDSLPVADALKYWGNRFPNAGYGSTFKSFLKPKKNKPFENTSTSNGAAMRVSPVALKAQSLEEALSLAKESAAPSHTGGGIKGAQAIAVATYIAKDGVALGKSADEIKADIRSFVEEHFKLNLNKPIDDIRELMKTLGAEDDKNSKTKKGKEKPTFEEWKTCDALLTSEMALTAVMLSNNYEEAIRLAISMGGDSDTIAAMAGSVAAQLYGIPEALIKKALVYLPCEMIDVINKFDGSDFQPTGIKPPKISRWCNKDIVVYGADPENNKRDEDGKYETIRGARMKAHPIPTIGKSLDEIQEGVNKFIEEAKEHPDKRYIVHKVGYHKAGYTVQQIAPFFKDTIGLKNVLLPEEMLNELKESK